ncbi:translocation/assembly module TamB domain-containing protein [Prevotella sp.]|uniref:translocation/assembly module TamB domain-containing protein n=1 Tax=Prevotella sp. TaxID=59823 RepID=UPI002E786C31|nr:translocation/assembly module TamB domain-containing protein [Prevotella sp.]MEE0669986.1 translocation/assembly module TamB domain-containing protein [Prevotella sp.]
MFKRIINITIWTLIGLYTAIIILLHIPSIQTYIGGCVADALCDKFGTKVKVGRVDLGFINRLILDDSYMQDKNGEQMLRVSRISVKINLLALANGQIEITSAQFFGLHANLYKATPEAKPNFQFVIDALASKDSTKQKTPLDLQINSLIIRNGEISYRVLSRPSRPGKFSADDINARNISAHIIINRITDDSLNVKVKRIAFDERCGFKLKSLSLSAIACRTKTKIENFKLELPATLIQIPSLQASYRMKNGQIEMPTLQFEGSIKAPYISPSDLAVFVPTLTRLNMRPALDIQFNGTGSSLTVKKISINTTDGSLQLVANGGVKNYPANPSWYTNIDQLKAGQQAISNIYAVATGKNVPNIIERLGNVQITGYAGGDKKNIASEGKLNTSPGNLTLAFDKRGDKITAHMETVRFNIGSLVNENKLGHISANLNVHGSSKDNFAAQGRVYDFDYNGYKYRSLNLNATYRNKRLEGKANIDDPNVQLTAIGTFVNNGAKPNLQLKANIAHFEPNTLRLTDKWQQTAFAANIACDIKGSDINNADGSIELHDFAMRGPETEYNINNVSVKTGYNNGNHFLDFDSDFGTIDINGHFSYNTIVRSVLNMVAAKLPTIPGLTHKPQREFNDFTLNASLNSTEWMNRLLGIPLEIHRPLNISGEIDDKNEKINLWCDVPSFTFNGNRFSDAFVNVESPSDTLKADIRIKKLADKGKYMALHLNAGASDNHLNTSLSFSNNERHPLKGIINSSTVFAKDEEGVSTAYIDVLPSRATIGDTTWHVAPSSIIYSKNKLQVNSFSVSHDNQMLAINGTATKSENDSLLVTLNDIDVSYVLNLVNFHSVDFLGMASGEARIAGAFSEKPLLSADVIVKDFKFETGRMGTLYANVGYNHDEGNIEINAVAKDEDNRWTDINGYVSPKHNYIDLAIDAHRTRAEFMESFCGSFMDNVNADINGNVNVVGPLNNINLVGKAVVDGSVRLSALNTTYWMRGDSVTFVPDEIKFKGDTLYDRNGNIGIMTGSIYHKHLTNLSYALKVKAKNLLAYDTHSFGDNTFYGTAYVTGDCDIKGKSGEVVIDIDAVPEKNSILVYNAADQSSIGSTDFITWKDNNVEETDSTDTEQNNKVDISTNIRLNFLINCNPNATLKLIMDEKTGDYITLNGDGVLRASYFNKGSFDIYGNYIVDHGVYKLTIQNIIKKDFTFQKGGSISFGGDPYNAALNLKALYVLNSVSLADLNIGRSFSNNNVRVNCLMNITGNPNSPKVDFDLDMPNMSNDIKQMVYSLLNAEEEKNQQVLYLLAVGRFMAQNNNNNATGETPQYSQTSLAMQSFLSGTISQQLNSVLSNVINSSNWNFGANISTGTEGFNNAEYEGMLSGSLLNNRLLFNGQFGYRDNANATTSFIGDFDLKYLLFPNGNLAINVYNKTNDRYFTRNSLNTQGLGVIMKKDFTRISDLFFWRKKEKTKK